MTQYWNGVAVPVSVFHKAGAEFDKAAPSIFRAWCRRAELRRLGSRRGSASGALSQARRV